VWHAPQEPLRLTLKGNAQGQRKVVVLHPRTMDQLFATIKQKFRYALPSSCLPLSSFLEGTLYRTKAQSITDATTGQTITQTELQKMSQDAVLHFS
jgi:hypothetical protein